MKQFKDLEFKKVGHGGFGSHSVIGDHVLSVQCGQFVYSTPRENLDAPSKFSSFEIAIWKNDSSKEFVTDQFTDTDDEVAGWVSRDEITGVIQKLKNEKE